MAIRLCVLFLLLISIGRVAADAGRLDPGFVLQSAPNGAVHTVLELPDGSIIIGGEFTQVGTVQQAYLAKIDASGILDTNFTPALDAAVFTIEADINVVMDGFYIGGSFTTANQTPSKGVVKLQIDGTLHDTPFTVGNGFDGPVYTLKTTTRGTVLVGGNFDFFQGSPARNLVALAGHNASLVANCEASDTVYTISDGLQSGTYICAGNFLNINGSTARRIASIDGSGNSFGSPNPWPIANGAIRKVKILHRSGPGFQVSPIIVFSGDFTSVQGVSSTGLASYLIKNGSFTTISFGSSGASSATSLLVDAENRLLVANDTGSIWGFDDIEYVSGKLTWKSDTNLLPHLHANAAVRCIHQSTDGRYYIGGEFTTVDAIAAPYFARLHGPQGTAVPEAPTIKDFQPTDNRAYIELLEANYLLSYELQISSDEGTTWRSWLVSEQPPHFLQGFRPATDYWIRVRVENVNGWGAWGNHLPFSTSPLRDAGTLAYVPNPMPFSAYGLSAVFVDSNGHLGVVGTGAFHDTFTGDLIVVNDRLQLQYKFNSTNNPRVNTAAPIVSGGYYVEHTSGMIERSNANGIIDTDFSAGYQFGSNVVVLATQSDGKLLVGGTYTKNGGAPNDGLVRLNANGEVDATYAPELKKWANAGTIEKLVIFPDDSVLAIGYFDSVNGTPIEGGAVKLTPSGAVDTSFFLDPTHYWDVEDAVIDAQGRVILAGLFNSSIGVQRVNADGSIDSSWQGPAMTYKTNSTRSADLISMQTDGKLVVAGSFTEANGQSARGIARLNTDGSLDTSFDVGLGNLSSSGLYGSLTDIVCLPNGTIAVVGWFSFFDGNPNDGFALIRGNTPLSQFQQWLLMHGLPLDSDPSADDDGDGVALAFEFAYHMNPHKRDVFTFIHQQGSSAKIAAPAERVPNMQWAFSTDLTNWQYFPIRGDWCMYPPSGSSNTNGFYRVKINP